MDRVGVYFTFLDGLLAFGLTVETGEDDLLSFAGFFQRGASAEGGGVIDGEDAAQVGVGLERVFGGFVAGVFGAAAFEFGDDLDFARGFRVVGVDDPPTRSWQLSACLQCSTATLPPASPRASIMARAASLPPPKLSVATCVRIFAHRRDMGYRR